MTVLVIVNDAPYGNERPYNALRLAVQLSRDGVDVRVFLLADGVFCGLKQQQTPEGYYNIETFLKRLVQTGQVRACGTCMSTRGLSADQLIDGIIPSKLTDLSAWVQEADKVLTF